MENKLPPNKHVRKHIIEGIKFADEILDALDEISLKYNTPVSYTHLTLPTILLV